MTQPDLGHLVRRALVDLDEREEALDHPAVRRMLEVDAEGRRVVPDGEVCSLFFHEGDDAAGAIRALSRFSGYPQALEEYAANLLRIAASEHDGTLDVVRLDAWCRRYRSALSEMPVLRDKVERAREANMAVHRTIVERDRKLRDFRDGPAGLYLDRDPAEATAMLFDLPDTAAAMASLLQAAASNRAMLDGLRVAVRDHVRDRVGVGSENALRYLAFLDANRAVLALLFEPDAMDAFERIGLDLSGTLHPQPLPPAPQIRRPWWSSLFGDARRR